MTDHPTEETNVNTPAPQVTDVPDTPAVSLPSDTGAPREAAPAAPDGLAGYWDAIDGELSAVPAAPEEEHLPLHSTGFATCYRVRLTSIGPYRITAYLTLPTADGPHPALFLVPGYGSVVTPPTYEDRERYICLSLMHRGARHADKPYTAKYPGLLTDGIEDPSRWMFRAIMADMLRGFEYLLGRPEADPARVAIQGSDAGLLVATRRPNAAAIAVNGTFFHRLAQVYPATEAYPLEEINDHLRAHPDHQDAIEATVSLFDPLYQAGAVHAQTLISIGDPGKAGDLDWFRPLTDAMGGEVAHYPVTHEGQTDRDAVDAWLAGQLGSQPRPRTWVPAGIGAWS